MKNNKYWFRPKSFGYGLTPISWEGWLCTLALVGIIIGLAYVNNFFEGSEPKETDACFFVGEVFIVSFLFLYFGKDRTDGKITWNWGIKKSGKKDSR